MTWSGERPRDRIKAVAVQEMGKSSYRVTLENFKSLRTFWSMGQTCLNWNCIFMLPPWLETWWGEFGSSEGPSIYVVREGEALLGVAPFERRGECFVFIGSPDLCDCLDFIVSPGREGDFFGGLLDQMEMLGIRELDLRSLRPDSTALLHFAPIAQERGYRISCAREDISVELPLPSTWENYLCGLTGKQRHEVRRKLRRIEEAGKVTFRILGTHENLSQTIELFLQFFRKSRNDKEGFMTVERESFFTSLSRAMADVDLLRLGILELDERPIALLLCFDYDGVFYLYNSGYDPQYRHVSAGLISKILCIRDSIDKGKVKFDFLRGDELYKRRLGGVPVALYRCRVVINE